MTCALRAGCKGDEMAGEDTRAVTVRKAVPQDLDAVARIYEAACTDMAGTEFDIEWVWGNYPTREGLAERIAAGELLLAERAGAIAGACVIDNADDPTYAVASWRVDVPQPEVGVLHLFVIDPACRRQGIAPVLLEAAAQEARKRGFATLRLDVFDNNEPAVRLYLAHGYEDRGVFTLHYGDGVVHAAHLMELDLRA